jgi:alpha-beta hydrolase superfamily lysophospholipase
MARPVFAAAALAAGLLAACSTTPPAAVAEAPAQPMACPAELPAGAQCWQGRDSAGAYYLVARPAQWNGHLVLHAHGGPTLGPPKLERAVEDLKRWAIMVKAGYAWAGSTFRQGGVAVRAAAEDTERLRPIAIRTLGRQPTRTILHGQSWGGGVAAVGAEMFTAGKPYDAVLLTSGLVGGGSRSYDFRLDLRVVYQALCHNHPRPDEPQYPLWMGLPVGSTMSPADLAARARECLGTGLPAAQRTAAQAQRLKQLAEIIRIPESSVLGHLTWATFTFAEIAQRYGGKSVFGNEGVSYGDAALDAAVQRYRADPAARAAFAADTDPGGRIPVPVLSVHAIHDPVVFVEVDHRFRRTMQEAGTADHLVQTFTTDREHSYLTDPVYPALLEALLQWMEQGVKPTPTAVAARCAQLQAQFGPGCNFDTAYQPAALETRSRSR